MQRRIKYQITTAALVVLRMYSWNLKVSYWIENKSVSLTLWTSWVNLDLQREPKSSWDYVASPRFVFCEPYFFHDKRQRQGFFKGLCVWDLIFLCVCVFAWVSLCFSCLCFRFCLFVMCFLSWVGQNRPSTHFACHEVCSRATDSWSVWLIPTRQFDNKIKSLIRSNMERKLKVK